MTKSKKCKKDENENHHSSSNQPSYNQLFIEANKFASPRNKSQFKLFQCLNNQEYKIIYI